MSWHLGRLLHYRCARCIPTIICYSDIVNPQTGRDRRRWAAGGESGDGDLTLADPSPLSPRPAVELPGAAGALKLLWLVRRAAAALVHLLSRETVHVPRLCRYNLLTYLPTGEHMSEITNTPNYLYRQLRTLPKIIELDMGISTDLCIPGLRAENLAWPQWP